MRPVVATTVLVKPCAWSEPGDQRDSLRRPASGHDHQSNDNVHGESKRGDNILFVTGCPIVIAFI